MYAALPYFRVNSSAPLVCRHDRVTREVGRVGLVGGIGGGGDIEWRYTCISILPGFQCQCFSRCLIQACMPAGRPSHSAHLAPSAWAER